MNLSLVALFLYEKRRVRKLIYCFYGNTNKNYISTISINFFKQCLKYKCCMWWEADGAVRGFLRKYESFQSHLFFRLKL